MFKRLFNEAVLDFTILPDGPLLIKAGETGADPTRPDMEFVRTWRGSERVVYLPGSSLKGVLRAHCERIVRTVDTDSKRHRPLACDPLQNDKRSCSKRLNDLKPLPTDQTYRDSCFICQIFGNQMLAGRLHTSDAYPIAPIRTEQRDGVAIDRVFGSVAVGPFQYETVSEGAFKTTLTIRNFTLAQLGLLGLALRDLRRGQIGVGFGKSRGLGRVKAEYNGLVIRYPACELRQDGLHLLGHTERIAPPQSLFEHSGAKLLAGAGAFHQPDGNYGLSTDDQLALPGDLQLGLNEWQEVELALAGDQVETLWRAAVPYWRTAMGMQQ